jgi:lipoprotein-releasing system ATP-binding protein
MLEVRDLVKEYPTANGHLRILSRINLTLAPGESMSIVGPSGSGKSTLLYILGALEPPTSGSVALDGQNPFALDEKHLAAFRNRQVGFVFQDHHLLPQCSVLENVLIPTLAVPKRDGGAERRASELLERVGLGHRLDHRPAELSGGEKQRAALARALICKPRLLLCDEPTGNLDRAATENVASLLEELHASEKTMLVVVTHNLALAARFARRYRLEDSGLCPLQAAS